MTDHLFIEKKYAHIDRTDKANCAEHGVRLYRESPVNARLQIRTSTTKLGFIASTSLNVVDCQALAATLLAIASDLSVETAGQA